MMFMQPPALILMAIIKYKITGNRLTGHERAEEEDAQDRAQRELTLAEQFQESDSNIPCNSVSAAAFIYLQLKLTFNMHKWRSIVSSKSSHHQTGLSFSNSSSQKSKRQYSSMNPLQSTSVHFSQF
jgi:hypothetical protein